ncbi:MAG: hypothetical protein ACLFTF_07015, partial [Desulfonatronovibrio sp.]
MLVEDQVVVELNSVLKKSLFNWLLKQAAALFRHSGESRNPEYLNSQMPYVVNNNKKRQPTIVFFWGGPSPSSAKR